MSEEVAGSYAVIVGNSPGNAFGDRPGQTGPMVIAQVFVDRQPVMKSSPLSQAPIVALLNIFTIVGGTTQNTELDNEVILQFLESLGWKPIESIGQDV